MKIILATVDGITKWPTTKLRVFFLQINPAGTKERVNVEKNIRSNMSNNESLEMSGNVYIPSSVKSLQEIPWKNM
jgi:hypothetical protein